jgi:hypothetical protein
MSKPATIRDIRGTGAASLPGVSRARKAQVSKNGDGCTHPADVVRVAGSRA